MDFILIGYLLILPVAFLFLGFIYRRSNNRVTTFNQDLQTNGYGVIYQNLKNGPQTYIVSILPKPSQIDLIVSDLLLGHKLAPKKHLAFGSQQFNQRFFVSSNHEDAFNKIMTSEVQDAFLSLPPLTCETGSYDELMPYDFWPKEKKEQSLRKILHFRMGGHVKDPQVIAKVAELGRKISATIDQLPDLGLSTKTSIKDELKDPINVMILWSSVITVLALIISIAIGFIK